MSVIVSRKDKIRSSQTRTSRTLFYTKRSRVSWIRAITDTDTGEEKRTGEVPTIACPHEPRLCPGDDIVVDKTSELLQI